MLLRTPSLGELVDFTSNESSKEFLGEGVVYDITCYNVRSREATDTACGEECAYPPCVGGLRRA